MSLLYLAALLLSIAGSAALDWRYRLAFWAHPLRTLAVVGIAVVGFVLWDLRAIALGIFVRGDAPWMTGLQLAPELPIEEPVFLALLSYVTLLLYLGAVRWLDARAARHKADTQ